MHPTINAMIAAEKIADWHREAARQRLARQLRTARAASPRNGRMRAGSARFGFRRSRPAAA